MSDPLIIIESADDMRKNAKKSLFSNALGKCHDVNAQIKHESDRGRFILSHDIDKEIFDSEIFQLFIRALKEKGYEVKSRVLGDYVEKVTVYVKW